LNQALAGQLNMTLIGNQIGLNKNQSQAIEDIIHLPDGNFGKLLYELQLW
jgi:hypothetical protein